MQMLKQRFVSVKMNVIFKAIKLLVNLLSFTTMTLAMLISTNMKFENNQVHVYSLNIQPRFSRR